MLIVLSFAQCVCELIKMGNNPSNSNHQQLERGGGVGKFGDVHAVGICI